MTGPGHLLLTRAARSAFVDPVLGYWGRTRQENATQMPEGAASQITAIAGKAIDAGLKATLRQAAARTGATFDVLYKIAERESAFDAGAKAATSSAAGLFQFIEQTWFAMVKNHGAKHGLGNFAADIERDATGRFAVADAARRAQILDLRFDAAAASSLAGELVAENKAALEANLGRAATPGEVYAAHFLGVAGAKKLAAAPRDARAADLLPAAAKANAPVFYDRGVPRSVGALIESFERSMGGVPGGGVAQGRVLEGGAAETRAPATRALATAAGTAHDRVEARPLLQSALQCQSAPQPLTQAAAATSSRAGERGDGQRPFASITQRLSARAIEALQTLDPTVLRRDRETR